MYGWHREGGIHPRVQHHPRAGSLHPVPAQGIPRAQGMMQTLHTPCPGQRGPSAPQPWDEDLVAAVLGECSVKGSASAWEVPTLFPGVHGVLAQLATAPTCLERCQPSPPAPAGSGTCSPAPRTWFKGWPWALGTFSWDQLWPRPGLHGHVEKQL